MTNKSTVGGYQLRYINTPFEERRNPGAVRSQSCPAAAAQRQYGRSILFAHCTVWRIKLQLLLIIPTRPAVTGVQAHARLAQAAQPGA